jgi:hypothetical protein
MQYRASVIPGKITFQNAAIYFHKMGIADLKIAGLLEDLAYFGIQNHAV